MFKNSKFPILIMTAAGALLGYLAASGNFALNRPARAQTGQEQKVISFEVLLPAGATLEIDGNKTDAIGETRTSRTTPVAVRGRYAYTLKAKVNGKEVTRQIKIAFGEENRFDLRGEFRAGGQGQPGAPAEHPAAPIG